MGKFTGKSDFQDWCEMHNTPDKIVKNAKIYLGDARVDIRNENDLIPYYTHLIAVMTGSNEGETIHLSSSSYLNTQEQEAVSWKVRDCIHYARKAKKEKKPFNWDYMKDKVFIGFSDGPEVYKQIIDIINNNPDIIKFHLPANYASNARILETFIVPEYFNDVHLKMYNYWRTEFVEFAKSNGYKTFTTTFTNDMKQTGGIYHPVIWDMCYKISKYEVNRKKYD